jgi:RNA polymerase sigma-70 factor (ECF subfamily)
MNQIPLNVYNEVYEDAHKKLLSFSFGIVKDAERAEDVVQETFKKFFCQDYEKLKDHVNQWLFTVCRNTSFKVLAKNKRYVEYFESDSDKISDDLNPSEDLELHELKEHLIEAMSVLTDREMSVIKCRFFHDMSYEESAKALNTSTGNIGFMQHSAIKKLKNAIQKSLSK